MLLETLIDGIQLVDIEELAFECREKFKKKKFLQFCTIKNPMEKAKSNNFLLSKPSHVEIQQLMQKVMLAFLEKLEFENWEG